MTHCGKRCENCQEARRQGNRTVCVFYGMPIWKEETHGKKTPQHDADLRGLRKGNPDDARVPLQTKSNQNAPDRTLLQLGLHESSGATAED